MNDFRNTDELVISMRQAQIFVAICLFGSFAFFAVGYFFGQRHALQTLVENANNTVVSDEIRTNFYHQAATLSAQDSSQGTKEEPVDSEYFLNKQKQNIACPEIEKNMQTEAAEDAELVASPPLVLQQSFYAPLVGFGTLKAAENFISRWPEAPIAIKKQVSRSTKGKEVVWYQVVTIPFVDESELQRFAAHIKKKERLKDAIKIIPIKS